MSVKIPKGRVAFYDEVFAEVVEYLKETGEIGEDEEVLSADFHVEAEELITVDNIETRVGNPWD